VEEPEFFLMADVDGEARGPIRIRVERGLKK
jgi:hypothetical protein